MPSRFEVIEEDCIGCGLCSQRAPENFEVPADTRLAQVFKQPETSAEEEACLAASDYCPVGGVQVGAVAADSSTGGAQATLIPAGDSTPVNFAS
ncbi:MAG: ferredoxin [Deltaproteobacteria bacterium]|nr:ferredoxin [Deltaproteobacteria bacterium]MBW2360601.1 ferredoxin [Deltaproteobacteria bacterium]